MAKHWQHVKEMRRQISQRKHNWLLRYKKENWHTIKDLDFQPGSLVLIQNTEVESSLDKKMKPGYMGPMIARHKIELPTNILELLDIYKNGLWELEKSDEEREISRDFLFDGV